MKNFFEFLIEAAGEGMQSNIKNVKTKGHIKRYILPYLSSEQKKKAAKGLQSIFNDKDRAASDLENHGANYNPDAESTHTLSAKHGEHEKGAPVTVTDLHIDGDTVMAKTKNHGIIPISKLGKPEKLAAANKTSEGFELESILQKNIDPRYKPAGSSGESWDFVAGDPDSDQSIKGKAVKKDESKPIFRGESKASKKGAVAMGTISAEYIKDKGLWEYSGKSKSKMKDKFAEAVHPESGLSIIDHLNKFHKDGKITSGFSIDAPQGTTRHYLNGLGANSLHLHRYAKDANGNYTMNHGTTYTIGEDNAFKGALGLGHLSDKDLDALDGKLAVEPSGAGKIQIKHRPKPGVFNSYANKSKENPNEHMDLSKEEHGNIFKTNFVNHLKKLKTQTNTPSPASTYHPSHGGKMFNSPDEHQHIQGLA